MTTHAALSESEFLDQPGIALVTGGSGGIGAAIVRLLVQAGSQVAITYRSNWPDDLLAELGDRVEAHQLDVTDADRAVEIFADLQNRHGAVHTVVHAAGPHVPLTYLSRVTPVQFEAQVQNDLVGFFNVAHAALPALRASHGSITAITTAATRRYPSRDGLSAAPKGGVEALARGIAHEEGRFGIRVNCVGPGMLTDGMAERLIASGDMSEQALEVARANIPLRRFGRAEDIAQIVVFLASSRAQFISGQKIDVDGGYEI
jgi:3-oxoacyl-[acyl-carrier protein] reductase